MNWVFGAGLILLALAAAADFLGGRLMRAGPLYLLGAAGSGCLAVTGGVALTGRLVTLGVGGWLGDPVPGQPTAGLAADPLSGMFLAIMFGAALPVSVAFASWARRQGARPGRLGASYNRTTYPQSQSDSLDYNYAQGEVGLTYQLAERWTLDAGYRYSRAHYSQNSSTPCIVRSGRMVMPGVSRSTKKAVIPSWPGAVRVSRMHRVEYCA